MLWQVTNSSTEAKVKLQTNISLN